MPLHAKNSRLSSLLHARTLPTVSNTTGMARASRAFARYSSSSTTSRVPRLSPRVQRGTGLLTAGALITVGGTIYADSAPPDNGTDTPPTTTQTVGSLIRSYLVYTMCSVPALVDYSPQLLAFLTSIPGIKQITETVVRVTFFDQVRTAYSHI